MSVKQAPDILYITSQWIYIWFWLCFTYLCLFTSHFYPYLSGDCPVAIEATVKSISKNIVQNTHRVWTRYLVWKFRGYLWHSTNYLPHILIYLILYKVEILRALRLKSPGECLKMFLFPHAYVSAITLEKMCIRASLATTPGDLLYLTLNAV